MKRSSLRRQVRPQIGRIRAFGRYFSDPKASIFGKVFVLAAVVYVICPIDLIPDVPFVGWLDDLGVASLALGWVNRVVGRYREASGTDDELLGEVVDPGPRELA